MSEHTITTYEFALGGTSSVGSTTYIGVCQQLFGMMAGSGYDTGGRAITVDFEIPPVDWESYEDGRFSTSSPRLELYPETAGSSQIDDWVTDGTRAAGSAARGDEIGEVVVKRAATPGGCGLPHYLHCVHAEATRSLGAQ